MPDALASTPSPLLRPGPPQTAEPWPQFSFESKFVGIGGRRVHYVDEGAGPVLFFLHPAPAASYMYREFIRDLRSRFRCIAMDYPGFGKSEPFPHGLSLPALRDTVAAFVEALDLRGITLVAHDSGGPIGFGAAVQAPDRYRAFVVSDTFAFPLDDYRLMRTMLRLVTGGPFRAVNRRWNLMARLVSTLAPARRRLPAEVRATYRRLFPTKESRDRILDIFRELLRCREYLHDVEAGILRDLHDRPVLIMYGQFDPARLIGWPKRFRRLFPNHRMRVVPWEGHFPHEGSPARMIDEIVAWHPDVANV